MMARGKGTFEAQLSDDESDVGRVKVQFADAGRHLAGYTGWMIAPMAFSGRIHNANNPRLDIDGGPMFNVSFTKILASFGGGELRASFRSNGIALRE